MCRSSCARPSSRRTVRRRRRPGRSGAASNGPTRRDPAPAATTPAEIPLPVGQPRGGEVSGSKGESAAVGESATAGGGGYRKLAQRGGGFRLDPTLLEGGQSLFGADLDHLLYFSDRTGPGEDLAQPVDPIRSERAVAEATVQYLPGRIVGALVRERDQRGLLVFAQVVTGRLTGLGWLTEHPENVVPELERFAQRQPVSGVRGQAAGIGVGKQTADV